MFYLMRFSSFIAHDAHFREKKGKSLLLYYNYHSSHNLRNSWTVKNTIKSGYRYRLVASNMINILALKILIFDGMYFCLAMLQNFMINNL